MLRTQKEIMKHWPGKSAWPLVSVCCVAYNHERYIRDAMEGFLMQETSFAFEILVHDDASTDRTADIIRAYQADYPDVVKPVFQTENQYTKGKRPGLINFQRAKGKYVALCEGDDFWIDPFKLQKQVDFLEANPGYGVVHTDGHFYYPENRQWLKRANQALGKNQTAPGPDGLFKGLVGGDYKVLTPTVLFKRALLEKRPKDDMTFLMGDTPMWLDFSQMTKFKYFPEASAVYRFSFDSVSRPDQFTKKQRFYLSMAEMRVYYSKKYGVPIDTALKKRYNRALLVYKMYDPAFEQTFPLFDPNGYEGFKMKTMHIRIWRMVFLGEFFLSRCVNAFKRKLAGGGKG